MTTHLHGIRVTSSSVEQTKGIAEAFAKLLRAGDVVLLLGEVGSGKTTFTQFLVHALGINALVSSPSFKLINEYAGNALIVYHFDLYRLSSLAEIEDIGWDEYTSSKNGICVIEWAEHAKQLWPTRRWEISFTHVDDTTRNIEITFKEKEPV